MIKLIRRDLLGWAFALSLIATLTGCGRGDPASLIGSAKSSRKGLPGGDHRAQEHAAAGPRER
jgi:hypothetical protein